MITINVDYPIVVERIGRGIRSLMQKVQKVMEQSRMNWVKVVKARPIRAICQCRGGGPFYIAGKLFRFMPMTNNGICQKCNRPRRCKECGKLLYPLGCRCGLI